MTAGTCLASETRVLPPYTLEDGRVLQDVVTVASDKSATAPVVTIVNTYDVTNPGHAPLVSHDVASSPGVGLFLAGGIAGAIPGVAAAVLGMPGIDIGGVGATTLNTVVPPRSASTNGRRTTVTGEPRARERPEPVAEPGAFLRICDAFGSGYFFIPGSQTCLRMSGAVRSEFHYVHNFDDKFEVEEPDISIRQDGVIQARDATLEADRDFDEFTSLARAYLFLDTRSQTDIGLVRTFIDLFFEVAPNDPIADRSVERFHLGQAFVQVANDWGTITAGRASSFFDFYSTHLWNSRIGSDDPTSEPNLFAVSFRLGDGKSITLAAEDAGSAGRLASFGTVLMAPVDRTGRLGAPDGIPDAVANIRGVPAGLDGLHGGQRAPDLVANARVSQAWGAAQAAVVAHPVRARFVGTPSHPSTEIGWGVSAGARANDILQTGLTGSFQATWAKGATAYVTTGNGAPVTDGVLVDLVGNGIPDDIDLTEAWSIRGGISARMASDWIATLAATYASVDLPAAFGPSDPVGNLDYDTWTVGGHLAWNPSPGFIAGLELQYERIAFDAGPATDRWGGQMRVQKLF